MKRLQTRFLSLEARITSWMEGAHGGHFFAVSFAVQWIITTPTHVGCRRRRKAKVLPRQHDINYLMQLRIVKTSPVVERIQMMEEHEKPNMCWVYLLSWKMLNHQQSRAPLPCTISPNVSLCFIFMCSQKELDTQEKHIFYLCLIKILLLSTAALVS